jgi:hypothetical protein
MNFRSSLLPLILAAACALGADASSHQGRTRWVNRGGQTYQLTRYNNGYSSVTRWDANGNAVYRGHDGSGGTFQGRYNGATGNSRSVGSTADGTRYKAQGHWNASTNTSRSRILDENGNRSRWWASYQTQYQAGENGGRARSRAIGGGGRYRPASQ